MDNKTKITNGFTEKDLDERDVIFIHKDMLSQYGSLLTNYSKKHNIIWSVKDAGLYLMFSK